MVAYWFGRRGKKQHRLACVESAIPRKGACNNLRGTSGHLVGDVAQGQGSNDAHCSQHDCDRVENEASAEDLPVGLSLHHLVHAVREQPNLFTVFFAQNNTTRTGIKTKTKIKVNRGSGERELARGSSGS